MNEIVNINFDNKKKREEFQEERERETKSIRNWKLEFIKVKLCILLLSLLLQHFLIFARTSGLY